MTTDYEPMTRPELIEALRAVMHMIVAGDDALPMLVDIQTILCQDIAMAEREDDELELH